MVIENNIRAFLPGEVLFNENDAALEMYLILSGKVNVYKQIDSGKKLPLAVLGPGSLVGEMSLISGRPRTATVIADDETEVKVITRDSFNHSLSGIQAWAQFLAKVLIERLNRLNLIIKESFDEDFKLIQYEEEVVYTRSFIFDAQDREDTSMVYLKGYFFKSDLAAFEVELNRLLRKKKAAIVLDFSEVIDVDNHTVNFLVNMIKKFKTDQMPVKIQNVQLVSYKLTATALLKDIVETISPSRRNVVVDEVLIKQNEMSKSMYIVKEGRFKVIRKAGETSVVLSEIGSGDVIGEMAMFSDAPRSASVVATKPGIVFEITREAIQNNSYDLPGWYLKIIIHLVRYIRVAHQRLDQIIKKKRDIFLNLNIDIDHIPDKSKACIFRLSGSLTHDEEAPLTAELSHLVESRFLHLILDFKDVSEMDSAIVPVLKRVRAQMEKQDGRLYLIHVSDSVKPLLKNDFTIAGPAESDDAGLFNPQK